MNWKWFCIFYLGFRNVYVDTNGEAMMVFGKRRLDYDDSLSLSLNIVKINLTQVSVDEKGQVL